MNLWAWLKSIFMKPEPFIPITGRITSYGYPHDTTPDNASLGKGKYKVPTGAWLNPLRSTSMAISRDVEAAFAKAGIEPKGRVDILLKCGAILKLTWDDRTARSYKGKALTGRFDLYSPVKEHMLDGMPVTGFRKG